MIDPELLTQDEIDENNLEADLADEHAELIAALVRVRARHGLTVADVAERMGVDEDDVAAFEAREVDPHLSTVRRYALSVGARIEYELERR